MTGPFEFSNPESVLMSAMDKAVAISIWDSKGELHEFVACPEQPGDLVRIWFGTREDFEVRA